MSEDITINLHEPINSGNRISIMTREENEWAAIKLLVSSITAQKDRDGRESRDANVQ